MEKRINTPITEEVTKELHSGDYVYITGYMYVARDAAHKRMIETLNQVKKYLSKNVRTKKFHISMVKLFALKVSNF